MIKLRLPQALVLSAYVIAGGASVIASLLGSPFTERLSRALLMPLLAVLIWFARPQPRDRWLMITGLLLAAAGDVIVMWHSTTALLYGVAIYFGTQLAYIAAFVRGGAIDGLRWMPVISLAYAAVFVVAICGLWHGFSTPWWTFSAYTLALTFMAQSAATFGIVVGVGGGTLMASHLLLAVGIAHPRVGAVVSAWASAAYIVGQGLIAVGWTRVQVHDVDLTAPAAGSQPTTVAA